MSMVAAEPPLFVAVLSTLAVMAAIVALFYPALRPKDNLSLRVTAIGRTLEMLSSDEPGKRGGRRKSSQKSIRDTLREIEEVQRNLKRMPLIKRLRQAGLEWSKMKFYVISSGAGMAGSALSAAMGGGVLMIGGATLAAGFGLPNLYLALRRRNRVKLMMAEFPNAVDVIVRGVKSGLPFPECLRIVARESQEPVSSEFQKIIQDLSVGMPMNEAIARFANRVPLHEARFFAIAIAIQARAGGSLSESLDNLSTVLRERNKMRGKIKAMSSEAKASGMIIGSLPIAVSFVVYLTSPDYISVLFTDTTGNIILVCSALWMSLGVFVMRQMINFDF